MAGTEVNNTFENNNLSGNHNLSNYNYGGSRGAPPDFASNQGRRDSPDIFLDNARGALEGKYNSNTYIDNDQKQHHLSEHSRDRNQYLLQRQT